MPKGPKGEKRPADVIGVAVKVMRIATGEIEDETLSVPTQRLPCQPARFGVTFSVEGSTRSQS